RFRELLAGCGVAIPAEAPYARHVYHVYAVRTPDREDLMKALAEQGIPTAIHYPVPVHLQPAYHDPAYGQGSFPHSEKAAREVVSLPMYPEMTEAHQERVSSALRALVGRR